MLEARHHHCRPNNAHSEFGRYGPDLGSCPTTSGQLTGHPEVGQFYHAPSGGADANLISPPESTRMPCAGPSTPILYRRTGCKLPSWSSPSACATEFVAGKSLAACAYGRGPTSKSATVTGWTKVRSKWIRSSQSAFRISPGSWPASLASWASSICSRWRSTAKARTSIWFGSTMCGHVGSGQVSASRPDCPDYREGHGWRSGAAIAGRATLV